jgi:hypothetical protein
MYEHLSSCPRHEAAQIAGLVERGIESVASARQLIDCSREDEISLRKFYGTWTALRAARYRREVLRQFEKLLRESTPAPRARVRARRLRIEKHSRSREASA